MYYVCKPLDVLLYGIQPSSPAYRYLAHAARRKSYALQSTVVGQSRKREALRLFILFYQPPVILHRAAVLLSLEGTVMLEVAVVGASGYGGGELLRLLLRHPDVQVTCAISETYAGKPLSAAFPGLTNTYADRLTFERYEDGSRIAQCDVVFLAQENTKAMQTAPHLIEAGCKIVDLSADFRFRDVDTYAQWYGMLHACPRLNEEAVYGMSELNKDAIRKAQIVGNPGCHATAGILALAPLVQNGLIELNSIIIDSKTGVSGAGRAKFSLDYHFPEINESVSAYKVAGTHRHTPEIEMALQPLANTATPLAVTFTPHLIPMTRGILATCYATLKEPATGAELHQRFQQFYEGAPFVAVVQDHLPATKHTLGTNVCHLNVSIDSRNNRVTIISCLDNLIKGAAGQAIQNMNLMCGLEENAGLNGGGLWP